MSPMRDGRTTSEDSATQLLICEPLSFAIHFSSSRGKTKSNFSSRISWDRDSWQGLLYVDMMIIIWLYDDNHIRISRIREDRTTHWVVVLNQCNECWMAEFRNMQALKMESTTVDVVPSCAFAWLVGNRGALDAPAASAAPATNLPLWMGVTPPFTI